MNTPHIINGRNETLSNKDHQILSFRKVDETLGWLSNMSPHPVRFRTILYPTCEHFFQCLRFENQEIRKEILKKKSPMSAKMISKKYKDEMVIIPRSQVDLDLMRTVIRMKMVFYPKLRNELILQDSNSVIIEDCSKRGGESSKFWGMKLTDDQWEGQNWLGRLWMEYRSVLQGKSVFGSLDTTIWPGSMWTELEQTLFKKIGLLNFKNHTETHHVLHFYCSLLSLSLPRRGQLQSLQLHKYRSPQGPHIRVGLRG